MFLVAERVNEGEIFIIAGGNTTKYRIVNSFEDLDNDLVSFLKNENCT